MTSFKVSDSHVASDDSIMESRKPLEVIWFVRMVDNMTSNVMTFLSVSYILG